jgi:hypothetical protein
LQAILDHLANIVRPAIRDYVAAEEALDAASASKDQAAIDAARHDVIRKARTAAVELNHLTDFVLHHQTPPMAFADLAAIRTAIRSVCMFARGPVTVQDTDLLRDAADALKHAVLGRQKSAIAGASAIVSISNGWGEMRYQEQKHGGKEQVTVQTKDGNKFSLLWIVHNTYDAWMTVLGQPQKPLGDFS